MGSAPWHVRATWQWQQHFQYAIELAGTKTHYTLSLPYTHFNRTILPNRCHFYFFLIIYFFPVSIMSDNLLSDFSMHAILDMSKCCENNNRNNNKIYCIRFAHALLLLLLLRPRVNLQKFPVDRFDIAHTDTQTHRNIHIRMSIVCISLQFFFRHES